MGSCMVDEGLLPAMGYPHPLESHAIYGLCLYACSPAALPPGSFFVVLISGSGEENGNLAFSWLPLWGSWHGLGRD